MFHTILNAQGQTKKTFRLWDSRIHQSDSCILGCDIDIEHIPLLRFEWLASMPASWPQRASFIVSSPRMPAWLAANCILSDSQLLTVGTASSAAAFAAGFSNSINCAEVLGEDEGIGAVIHWLERFWPLNQPIYYPAAEDLAQPLLYWPKTLLGSVHHHPAYRTRALTEMPERLINIWPELDGVLLASAKAAAGFADLSLGHLMPTRHMVAYCLSQSVAEQLSKVDIGCVVPQHRSMTALEELINHAAKTKLSHHAQ